MSVGPWDPLGRPSPSPDMHHLTQLLAKMDPSSNRKGMRPEKHITRACIGCRQRKSKCDGARPQCSNCRLHNQECFLPQEVDKRTVSSKERYTRLEQYAVSLESALLRNDIALPGNPIIQPPFLAMIVPGESQKIIPAMDQVLHIWCLSTMRIATWMC